MKKQNNGNSAVVKIDGERIMTAALGKVDESRYFEALGFFARVNNYACMLNQIGCLCELGEYQYATDKYCRMLGRYALTHDCYRDTLALGSVVERVVATFKMPPSYVSKSSSALIGADKTEIRDYPVEFDDDLYSLWGEEFIELLEDFADMHKADENTFYDVKSPNERYEYLRRQMRKAVGNADFAKAEEFKKQLVELPVTDVRSLSSKLFFLQSEERFEEGLQVAKSLAELGEFDFETLDCAIRVSAAVDGDDARQCLSQFLNVAYEQAYELNVFDLRDYAVIACMHLGGDPVVCKLARALYDRYEEIGCLALKICSVIFYNDGDLDMARDAALELLKALPNDAFALRMLEFIGSPNGKKRGRLNFSSFDNLYFDAPAEFTQDALNSLERKLQEEELRLNDSDHVSFRLLNDVCKALRERGDVFALERIKGVLIRVIDRAVGDDAMSLTEFCKEYVAQYLQDEELTAHFIKKLSKLGCREKILVTTADDNYILNLSEFSVAGGETFVNALYYCSALRKVSVKRLKAAYAKLKQTVKIDGNADDTAVIRNVAYAVMAISYKSFAKSAAAKYFDGESRILYDDFSALNENNV